VTRYVSLFSPAVSSSTSKGRSSRAQFVRVDEQADFSGLAGEQPCDARVEPPHDGPFGGRAARRAVTDVSDLIGEDFAVEQ
jgi:hypothetical protein